MDDPAKLSPLGEYRRRLRLGQLAYQVTAEGRPVFYPRVAAPGDAGPLTWAVSAGLGIVYSTTTVYSQDGSKHNVALVDLDEGFRMMSRIEDVDSASVVIGMRVRFRSGLDPDGEPIALFAPA